MKFLLILSLLLFSIFSKDQKTVENKGAKTGKSKQYNVIGITDSNSPDSITAVTYGTAQTGSFVSNKMVNLAGYKNPQMVERLPDLIPPPIPGPLESVQEIPSSTTYYDGSLNLNVGVADCHVIAIPGECVKQSVCGWCGQTSRCIRGTPLAPTENCNGRSYVFSAPSSQWNPLIVQR